MLLGEPEMGPSWLNSRLIRKSSESRDFLAFRIGFRRVWMPMLTDIAVLQDIWARRTVEGGGCQGEQRPKIYFTD